MNRPNAIIRFSAEDIAQLLNFDKSKIEISRISYEPTTDMILLGVYSDEIPETESGYVLPYVSLECFKNEEGYTKITKLIAFGKEIDCHKESEVAINE